MDMVRRLANLPNPSYVEDLPINIQREEIKYAIDNHQVVIVCGETGSGKTTQIPKICLELKRGVSGMIGHTQPRRIAARTVAARVAAELNSELGKAVGYKIRFTDKISPDTYVKLMTDGILLAETQGDPLLRAYDTLIIDEAHERSLNIDFLLGYIKQVLSQRPDLKLIVTSATIDAQRFSRHFNDAPVIEVTGRMYPVEICYRPLLASDEEDDNIQRAILHAIDELLALGPGDILVFLPGEREIREIAETLRKYHFNQLRSAYIGVEILPLFARLSFTEQERVFQAGSGRRRIVLATNVAETSLTVPGIHYVVDTGWARVNRYSYRNKVEQLVMEKISRASANQRAGRCGRVAEGICIRLYSEEDYQARAEFSDPEIFRSSLASVILRMKALKIGHVESFPFLESPSPRMIADGYQLLAELGAIDNGRQLTEIGRRLAKFPIDPRVARMVLAAKHENCLHEMLIIASALSVQDPRDRPLDKQAVADQAHLRFKDERSDFLSYLRLWNLFDELLRHKKSTRKLIIQCRDNFLSYRRLREWREIHGQLHVLVSEMGFRPNQIPASYDEIHRALLSGLLGNIGFKSEKEGEYLGARGIRFSIFPGSVLRRGKAKWVVAAELVETTKLYGRCAAQIEPNWLERIGGSLCKKHYFSPHWEKKQAQVIAYERVTLYGLTIIPKRPVSYSRINAKESREIFIRSALVSGEYITDASFFVHNQALIQQIEELEHKARRQNVLVDEQEIFAFYDALIPENITNGAGFEKWRKKAEQQDIYLLYLKREFLMRNQSNNITEEQFPESLTLPDGTVLPLDYRFDPGHALDGVTVRILLPLLNRLDANQLEYLVPGLIREKVTWYFKALPKQIRRNLVPLPESVTEFLGSQIAISKLVSLHEAIKDFVVRKTTLSIPLGTWKIKDMPVHLLMNIRVIDDAGDELAMSRNLTELQTQLGGAAQMAFIQRDTENEKLSIERDHITRWDFGDLPVEIAFKRNNQQLIGYPALIDQSDNVAIRLLDTRQAADIAMRLGIRRLLCLALKDQIKRLEKDLLELKQVSTKMTTCINASDLKHDIFNAIIDRAFLGDDPLPRSEKAFIEQSQQAKARLPGVAATLISLIQQIGQEYQILMGKLPTTRIVRVEKEVNEQLKNLIFPSFLNNTPWERLEHIPRYLKGMTLRLEKLSANPERDERNSQEINALWQQYYQRKEKHQKMGWKDKNLNEFRWQMEELCVSLFAQELKTPQPVSVKRLQKLWESVRL